MTNLYGGPGGMFARVTGQSGKITFGKTCNPEKDPNAVSIHVDSISEKDIMGQEVGLIASGKQNKHHLPNLLKTMFFVSDIHETSIQGICATSMNITAEFPVAKDDFTNSTTFLTLIIYFMCGNGTIQLATNTPNNESFSLKTGMMKFSVVLQNWPFCNGMNNNRQTFCTSTGKTDGIAQIGSFVDVSIVIGCKNPPSKGQKKEKVGMSQNPFFILGAGYDMEMSEVLHVNYNNWVKMPAGFPLFTSGSGNKYVFTIRIPKFSGITEYDPTISYSPVSAGGEQGTHSGSFKIEPSLIFSLGCILIWPAVVEMF